MLEDVTSGRRRRDRDPATAPRPSTRPWQTLTRIDPIYYLVDATRGGWTGVNDASIALALGVAAATVIALYAVAVVLLARGWRLTP